MQKTNRIRLKNATIYASHDAVGEIRSHLQRLNQILVPVKGHYEDLLQDLKKMVQSPEWKDHFPKSSRVIILSKTDMMFLESLHGRG